MSLVKPFAVVTVLLFGCEYSTFAQVAFQNVTQLVGIEHMHQSSELMGGGVAIFDFNNDGLQDIFLTGGEAQDKLLKNLGNWQFEDVSFLSGISSLSSEGSFGVTTGDIDNDGFRDILVTGDDQHPSRLFHNQGNETFVELTNAMNISSVWSTAASMGDVDGDGHLDIYIGTYIKTPGLIYDQNFEVIGFDHLCFPNYLFLNDRDLTFTDASVQYGVADTGCALAVAFSDFDFDNDIDLFLANDFGEWGAPSTIFENISGPPGMIDAGAQLEMNLEMYGMGIAIGDYDRDADLDYYQTNLGRNELSRNDGGGFNDLTEQANVENDSAGQLLHTGWGTFFFDADNDAWPDLFVSNGEIPAADIIANVELDSNRLYLNNGDATFSDISETAGVGSIQRGRGAAFGDLNNDGRLDFVVNNVGNAPNSAQFEIYRNQTNSGNWVAFQLRGTLSNRDAFGARVRVVINGTSTVAEVDGGSSHASQNSSVLHFGLGSETMADSVIVTFPSGIEQVLEDVSANQTIAITEDVTVSVSEVSESLNVKVVYTEMGPSVVAGYTDWTTIEVIDVSGKMVVASEQELTLGQNRISALDNQATGIYFLRFTRDGLSSTHKVVISE